MAIVLKEDTSLNTLVKKLERKKMRLKEDKEEIGKRVEELNKKISSVKKKYKKSGKREFNRRFGWIYAVLAFASSASFYIIRSTGNEIDAKTTLVLWLISMATVLFVSLKTKRSYINRYFCRATGEDITRVIAERDMLRKSSKDVILEEVTLINEITEHSAEIAGNQGEQSVVKYIKENFGDDTYLINDIYVKFGDKTTQIDHILVCPRGIFCIETKNYAFTYHTVNDDKWVFRKGREDVVINSPISQSVYHAEMLWKALPFCSEIIPLVVFANRKGVFDGYDNRCEVIYTKEILKAVKKYKKIYSSDETKEIAHRILGLHVPKY